MRPLVLLPLYVWRPVAEERARRTSEVCRWASFPSLHGSYLVDPASSHMLVSKIKPCMSKYRL